MYCCSDNNRTNVQLKLTRADGKTYVSAGTVHFPPQYDLNAFKGDIAIVVLKEKLPNIDFLKIDRKTFACDDSEDLVEFGFGITENKSGFINNFLKSEDGNLNQLKMNLDTNFCFKNDCIITSSADGTGCFVSIFQINVYFLITFYFLGRFRWSIA